MDRLKHQVSNGNLNLVDVATKDFDGVTMASYAKSHGMGEVQSGLDQLTALRK